MTFRSAYKAALLSSQVIDWIYSAAYAWIILYGVFHVLAICNRILRPEKARAFKGWWFLPAAALGAVTTGIGLYYAFAGSHFHYGPRVLKSARCWTAIEG
jgi:hypothetical protein